MKERNYIKPLIDYFKKNLKKGYNSDSLKLALIRQGYSRTEVAKAADIATKELAEAAPKLEEKPIIKYEVLDEHNRPIVISNKKSWWKKILGF